MEYWDPVSDAYMSKKASESIPKGNLQEISVLTRCKINLNGKPETAPAVDLRARTNPLFFRTKRIRIFKMDFGFGFVLNEI